ncbi:hypothetical protein NPIL_677121, partial [Nephila pilipes]
LRSPKNICEENISRRGIRQDEQKERTSDATLPCYINQNPREPEDLQYNPTGLYGGKVEALGMKYGPAQCFCCQRFFHSSQFRTRKPKCVKCAGNHFTKESTKTTEAPPECCLCDGAHPASYLLCPRNTINHHPNPKETAPPEKKWKRRDATSTPRQEPQQKPTPELSAENFPPLPAEPAEKNLNYLKLLWSYSTQTPEMPRSVQGVQTVRTHRSQHSYECRTPGRSLQIYRTRQLN